jgi:hypothetical protein
MKGFAMFLPVLLGAWILLGGQGAPPLVPPDTAVGPAEVCFRLLRFRLEAGETLEQGDVGIHGATVTVIRNGRPAFAFSEIETAAPPEQIGPPLARVGDMKVVEIGDGDDQSYGFMLPDRHFDGQDQVVGWLGSAAFTGGPGDADIYGRFQPMEDSSACDIQIQYGWSLFLGE